MCYAHYEAYFGEVLAGMIIVLVTVELEKVSGEISYTVVELDEQVYCVDG